MIATNADYGSKGCRTCTKIDSGWFSICVKLIPGKMLRNPKATLGCASMGIWRWRMCVTRVKTAKSTAAPSSKGLALRVRLIRFGRRQVRLAGPVGRRPTVAKLAFLA